jgi:predicted ribosome quality control (RQC) complex YloA/Tae2 family protein
MNERTIEEIVREATPLLVGRRLGKIFQLSARSCAFDFRLPEHLYLFVSVEPSAPRIHLIARKERELEKSALTLAPFFLALRKHLGGARLTEIKQDADERIVRFYFDSVSEVDAAQRRALVAQLTGRSANLFLLDEQNRIIDMLRAPREKSNEKTKTPNALHIGDIYESPPRQILSSKSQVSNPKSDEENSKIKVQSSKIEDQITKRQTENANRNSADLGLGTWDLGLNRNPQSLAPLSAALDEHYREAEATRAFAVRANAIAALLRQEISKRRKLEQNLERDLAAHGDAETHKRIGDLLLANLSTARRDGARVSLIDYFKDDAPTIEIEVDEKRTLQEEAARRFERYAKAKRAAQEINERLTKIRSELARLEERREAFERINASRDAEALARLEETLRANLKSRPPLPSARDAAPSPPGARARKHEELFKGARRYRSSDGYEILVGRAARDNDALTFRVARASDLWLHAADYPGSHVVVKNPAKGAIPQRTIIEAAQLAALFSQAKNDSKVAVNYTERKFVSKPKRAAPGLVSLLNFRTILVEPRESAERIL